MVFSGLSQRLQGILGKLKGRGRLSEADVKAALKEIKLALLEADVNYKVVKKFIATLQERCTGAEILASLTPGQHVIKIVRDELTDLLGSAAQGLNIQGKKSTYMLVGLQGAGKTTTTVKLASLLKSKGKRPLVVSLDTYRPAAIDQLDIAAQGAEIDTYRPQGANPVDLAHKTMAYLNDADYDVVLFDTAGRLHLDAELMGELEEIKAIVDPVEIVLVLDAMTGQDAVNIAQGAEIDTYRPQGANPVDLAHKTMAYLNDADYDVVLFDTAGRLHLDAELMGELEEIKAIVDPVEIVLVLDAMTGQDAVNIAQGFAGRDLTDSVVLTKLDSDTRGGAALSVRAITGKPIKYVGVGEKTHQLEQFHPDRMASQILGMGDVLSLIEKAEAAFDQEQAEKLQEKLRKQQFTLEDFREQMSQFRKMGSLDEIAGMLPGAAKLGKMQFDEREIVRFDAIISSMTPAERINPSIINGSRRKRIARGSGTSVQNVNKLLKQFATMQKMLKQFDGFSKKGRFNFPFKI